MFKGLSLKLVLLLMIASTGISGCSDFVTAIKKSTAQTTNPLINIKTEPQWVDLANRNAYLVTGDCSDAASGISGNVTLTFTDIASKTGTSVGPCLAGAFSISADVQGLGLAEGPIVISASVTDNVNNTSVSTPALVMQDTVNPTVGISAPSITPINSLGSTVYTLTFNDTNLGDLTTIVGANTTIDGGIQINNNGTTSGCTHSTLITGANTATVTVQNCSGGGNPTITANSSAWADLATNPLTANTSASFTVNNTPPTGLSILIDGGAPYTNTTAATLTLGATGATQMYITNTAGCAAGGSWVAYGTSSPWVLGQTNATATVYVAFKDSASNVTACINATIIHDNILPTVTVTSGPTGSNPANSTDSTVYVLTFADTNLGTPAWNTVQSHITFGVTWTAPLDWTA